MIQSVADVLLEKTLSSPPSLQHIFRLTGSYIDQTFHNSDTIPEAGLILIATPADPEFGGSEAVAISTETPQSVLDELAAIEQTESTLEVRGRLVKMLSESSGLLIIIAIHPEDGCSLIGIKLQHVFMSPGGNA